MPWFNDAIHLAIVIGLAFNLAIMVYRKRGGKNAL